MHEHTPLSPQAISERQLIYVFSIDDAFVKALNEVYKKTVYILEFFSDINMLLLACEKQYPAAIVLDISVNEKTENVTDIIKQIKNNLPLKLPLILVSKNNNINYHIEVAKAGVSRYFVKPIDAKKLFRSVDASIIKKHQSPYRVLLIDDEEALLRLNSTILENGGMEVETLSNSCNVLEVLDRFKPDVIVVDFHMPNCSGPDLARVIRLNDSWSLTPIMFLSAELDPLLQLDAMRQGADDFLVKPIESQYLLSVIYARAKRARQSKRMNVCLKETLRENKYQLITMDQHDIVSSADVKGNITSVNELFCEISGYSREELMGQNHRILKSSFHPVSFYDDMWRDLAQGKVWRGTICNRTKDGNEYWVESTIVPFLNNKGKPYKYVSARTDVTELRKSEERLYRSQSFANIGTWDWNVVTGELYWSERIGPLFGYKSNVPETTYDNFLAAIHPEDRQKVIDAVNNCVEKGDEYNIEHRVVWPDGSVHWVLEKGNVLRSENGAPLHMLGVVQDINQLKNTQENLIKARDEAEKANKAKSQFLSSMSHELRTPMNAILGFGQLLKIESDNINESQNENIDEIIKAGRHLLELINEVLDLSKIESGRIDLFMEDIALEDVMAESLQIISPLAQKREIEIEFKQAGNEVSFDQFLDYQTSIKADRTRLRQILLNLLSNAVKYNRENGKIIIACESRKENKQRISITDTGAGLSKQQQEKLFTAFERMGAEQSEVEGSGIGLLITKKIVDLMEGEIGVNSEEGHGSTFWVELLGAGLSSNMEGRNNNSEEDELNRGKKNIMLDNKKNVIYIEDNPANLRLVTQILSRSSGVELLTAPEPRLGIELAIEHLPDLILLDINLPGMNGYEVLSVLAQKEETKNIPVIAISANAMPQDLKKGREAGFTDYITKPIDVVELLETVDKSLKGIK